MPKLNAILLFAVSILIALISYFYLGFYFDRTQFFNLLLTYSVLFIIFVYWQNTKTVKARNLFQIGIALRVVLLFSTPFLSQDFYRFIWDGRLIFVGINPFKYVPNELISSNIGLQDSAFLIKNMGQLSASHYSNYPPLNQFLYYLAAVFSSKSIFGSIFFLKVCVISADIGIYFYGKKLLRLIDQSENKIFWYFLNPLVVLELTGNLHFEGVMLFFLVLGCYYFHKKIFFLTALFLALSISLKLVPLLLLPLFYKSLGFKKSLWFYALILLINAVLFLPFLTAELFSNYTNSVGLWFTNFEFNASLYYILRELGLAISGYNQIGIIGKTIPIATILCVLYYAFFKSNKTILEIIKNSLLFLTIYLFISTTVHPWYIINLIFLCVFTDFKYPIAWSFTAILSYFAYSIFPFQENLYLVFMEYMVVFMALLYELKSKKKDITLEKATS